MNRQEQIPEFVMLDLARMYSERSRHLVEFNNIPRTVSYALPKVAIWLLANRDLYVQAAFNAGDYYRANPDWEERYKATDYMLDIDEADILRALNKQQRDNKLTE